MLQIWDQPTKIYYNKPIFPDIALEEKPNIKQNHCSTTTIYEWNIDRQAEYQTLNIL